MNQMVYVVLDCNEVVGVYNTYDEAVTVASPMATITPVIVGKTDVNRTGCNTPDEVIEAMEHELSSAPSYSDSDDEDEDDEDDEDEDDEDEDEDEDMDSIIYDCDGQCGISADDARLLMKCVAKVMRKQFGYLPDEIVKILAERETLRIAEEWGIEVVDNRGE